MTQHFRNVSKDLEDAAAWTVHRLLIVFLADRVAFGDARSVFDWTRGLHRCLE